MILLNLSSKLLRHEYVWKNLMPPQLDFFHTGSSNALQWFKSYLSNMRLTMEYHQLQKLLSADVRKINT